MKDFFDVDIIVNNSIELSNLGDTKEPVISTEYHVDCLKAYICDNIADIQAELKTVTLYKGCDYSVRWNEQVVSIEGSKILDEKYEYREVPAKVLKIKKVSSCVDYEKLYRQKIYISIRVFPECLKKEERVDEDIEDIEDMPKDVEECFENKAKQNDEPEKEITDKDCRTRKEKRNKKGRKRKPKNAELTESNAADLLISILRNPEKK